MRSVSPELAAAIEAPERTVRLAVSVDWDGDGHGGVGTIDDVTPQTASVEVARTTTGTMPDEVQAADGVSALTATVDVAGGDVDDERLTTVRYWSRFNRQSPLYGRRRNGCPVNLAAEFLTETGWQSVPLVTGGLLRGVAVDVKGQSAALEVIDQRDTLRSRVDLPPMAAEYAGHAPGLEAEWVVSYVLWQAGMPLSPPPGAGCRWWAPMHGSLMPMLHAAQAGVPRCGDALAGRPVFGTGPFRLAAPAYGYITDDEIADGAAIWDSHGRATVRMEMWVYHAAGSSPYMQVTDFAYITPVDTGGSIIMHQAKMWINPGAGRVEVELQNDAFGYFSTSNNIVTVVGPVVPTGGGVRIGAHIDEPAGQVTFIVGTTTTVVTFTPTDALLHRPQGRADVSAGGGGDPHAEAILQTGITDTEPWQPTTWTVTADVDRLQNRTLAGIVPPDKPQQAWEILAELVAAEYGLLRVDNDGILRIWSRARLLDTPAQVVQRTVTSRDAITDLGYEDRRDWQRNVVKVTPTTITPAVGATVWSLTDVVAVAAGQSVTLTVTDADKVVSGGWQVVGTSATNADGSGDIAALNSNWHTTALLPTGPRTATLTIANLTTATRYLVDADGVPNVVVTATTLASDSGTAMEARDQASIDTYGELPLDVSDNPWVQDRGFALGLAHGLLGMLTREQVVITDLGIPADPRLEPWDRLRVVDSDGTMLDTDVWVEADRQTWSVGGEQTLTVRPARSLWVMGETPMGDGLMGAP